MMKDMYNKEVMNGDLMVEGNEDFCYIFKVENDKPKLVALQGIGKLQKYGVDDIMERDREVKKLVKEKKCPSFLKNYHSNIAERIERMKIDSLMKVTGIDEKIFNKFIDEGHESIVYDQQEEDGSPIACFPNEEIVGQM